MTLSLLMNLSAEASGLMLFCLATKLCARIHACRSSRRFKREASLSVAGCSEPRPAFDLLGSPGLPLAGHLNHLKRTQQNQLSAHSRPRSKEKHSSVSFGRRATAYQAYLFLILFRYNGITLRSPRLLFGLRVLRPNAVHLSRRRTCFQLANPALRALDIRT